MNLTDEWLKELHSKTCTVLRVLHHGKSLVVVFTKPFPAHALDGEQFLVFTLTFSGVQHYQQNYQSKNTLHHSSAVKSDPLDRQTSPSDSMFLLNALEISGLDATSTIENSDLVSCAFPCDVKLVIGSKEFSFTCDDIALDTYAQDGKE
ncbi:MULTISPECIES: hypothetical protein [Arcanobacterium]|uniref:Uncharacterized protein n=1 Tax=Arcanobacterium bovis TaxID=2529275 RepID=A0A4Q9UZB5_9ACTO|nr:MULTISPECIES: hypothetical protein [Arcanobacterium]MBM7824374.1 hypothetical protein [Arcanobacterium pluranimalium]TBW21083.1 hypothetical protein EZJ44_07200 [Arcanobacterium bovis]